MATLAFLERMKVHALCEDFEKAQMSLEKFRQCVFEDPPPDIILNCGVQFTDQGYVTRKCQIQVTLSQSV